MGRFKEGHCHCLGASRFITGEGGLCFFVHKVGPKISFLYVWEKNMLFIDVWEKKILKKKLFVFDQGEKSIYFLLEYKKVSLGRKTKPTPPPPPLVSYGQPLMYPWRTVKHNIILTHSATTDYPE